MSVDRLTDEQAIFAMQQMSRWFQTRAKCEANSTRGGAFDFLEGARMGPQQILGQFSADAVHSALLYRLLRGRDPLPEPPPLQHAYPVYPDWPYQDDA